jgi:hypothetical protein
MNPYIDFVASELAKRINRIIDLPFLSEEEEEAFFRLVVAKVLEVVLGQVSDLLGEEDAV